MEELFSIFEEMGYEYHRQGSLTDETYPDSFFTYWNIDTPNTKHRDNDVKEYSIDLMVYWYTNNASLIYSVMDEFIRQAKLKGFIVTGKAYDGNADKDNYFGRLVPVKIIHKEE